MAVRIRNEIASIISPLISHSLAFHRQKGSCFLGFDPSGSSFGLCLVDATGQIRSMTSIRAASIRQPHQMGKSLSSVLRSLEEQYNINYISIEAPPLFIDGSSLHSVAILNRVNGIASYLSHLVVDSNFENTQVSTIRAFLGISLPSYLDSFSKFSGSSNHQFFASHRLDVKETVLERVLELQGKVMHKKEFDSLQKVWCRVGSPPVDAGNPIYDQADACACALFGFSRAIMRDVLLHSEGQRALMMAFASVLMNNKKWKTADFEKVSNDVLKEYFSGILKQCAIRIPQLYEEEHPPARVKLVTRRSKLGTISIEAENLVDTLSIEIANKCLAPLVGPYHRSASNKTGNDISIEEDLSELEDINLASSSHLLPDNFAVSKEEVARFMELSMNSLKLVIRREFMKQVFSETITDESWNRDLKSWSNIASTERAFKVHSI